MDPEDPDSDLDQWINPKIVSFLPFQSYLSLKFTFHGPQDPDSDLDQWINPKIVSFLPFQTYPENFIEIRQ